MNTSPRRVLVAGIGNIFLSDDGFGVEVVRRIDATMVPPCVDVADYGIRGIHLAYDLLDQRYDTLIMVDAAPLEGPPGTLAVLDAAETARTAPTGDMPASDPFGPAAFDGHSLHPQAVLDLLRKLGGWIDRVLLVGCAPAELGEGVGLSIPVRTAVDAAATLVTALAREEAAGGDAVNALRPEGWPAGA